MSTNDVIKTLKTALNGKYWAEIFLSLNIMLTNFLATLRLKSLFSLSNWGWTTFLPSNFCQIHSLKQLITCPTRVTCNMSTFVDHILTNFTEKIFQSSITDSEISNHQLIFCTRNNVFLRSFKHCTVNSLVRGLRKVIF